MITDYTSISDKREVQKKLFPLIHKRKMVALGGPDMVNYLRIIPKKIREIEIWENDRRTMNIQMGQISGIERNISYTFKDVLHAEIDKRAFYDLDFCCSVRKAEKVIQRFKNCAFSITLSLRPVSMEETLRRLFLCLDEVIVREIPHPEFNMVKTNKNEYLYTTYEGTGSYPMFIIFKFH